MGSAEISKNKTRISRNLVIWPNHYLWQLLNIDVNNDF